MNDLNLVFLQDNCVNLSVGLFHISKRLEGRRRGWRGRKLHDRRLARGGEFRQVHCRALGLKTRRLLGELIPHWTDVLYGMLPHRRTDLRGRRAWTQVGRRDLPGRVVPDADKSFHKSTGEKGRSLSSEYRDIPTAIPNTKPTSSLMIFTGNLMPNLLCHSQTVLRLEYHNRRHTKSNLRKQRRRGTPRQSTLPGTPEIAT